MKRCPTCSRVYDDVSLRFCLDDGTELVNKVPEGGAPETAVIKAPVENGAPTMKGATPPVVPAAYENIPPTVPAVVRKRSLLPWLIGGGTLLLILIGTIVALLMVLLPRPPLTWHLVMRVVPATGGNQGNVVNQTVAVLTNRLNAAGVSHFEIKPLGDQIFLDLPTVSDPERIKYLISTGGKLELLHVISPPSPAPFATYKTQEEAIASLNSGGSIPGNRRLLPYAEREAYSPAAAKTWVVVESPAIVSGGDLRNASAAKSAYGENYDVVFSLNRAGAQRFGSWTAANFNEYLGVALNDEVKSIAYIKSQITDQGQISGNFTKQSAEDLALVLKSGALPARVEFQEERIDK
jgi:protein-export membrane protein SecD